MMYFMSNSLSRPGVGLSRTGRSRTPPPWPGNVAACIVNPLSPCCLLWLLLCVFSVPALLTDPHTVSPPLMSLWLQSCKQNEKTQFLYLGKRNNLDDCHNCQGGFLDWEIGASNLGVCFCFVCTFQACDTSCRWDGEKKSKATCHPHKTSCRKTHPQTKKHQFIIKSKWDCRGKKTTPGKTLQRQKTLCQFWPTKNKTTNSTLTLWR